MGTIPNYPPAAPLNGSELFAGWQAGRQVSFPATMLPTVNFTVTSANGQAVNTLSLLQGIAAPASGQVAYLGDLIMPGMFEWLSGDQSANVDGDPYKRKYAAHLTIPKTSGCWERLPVGLEAINLRDYRIKGNTGNDYTGEFNNAIAQAAAAGGGKILLPSGAINISKASLAALGPDPAGGLIPIEICGVSQPSSWYGTLPSANFHMGTGGSFIITNATGGAALTVNPTANGGYNFSWYHLILRDLAIRAYDNPNISGVDATWAQQLSVYNVMIDNGVFSTASTQPTHTSSYAIITPGRGNGALNQLKNVAASGFNYGYGVNEHTLLDYTAAVCCNFGYQFMAADHASAATRFAAYRCPVGLTFDGPHAFNWLQYDIEHANAASTSGPDNWQRISHDIADALNYWHGEGPFWSVEGNMPGTLGTFSVNGGANARWWRLGDKLLPLSILLYATQSIGNNSATPINFTNYGTECASVGADPTKIVIAETGTYELSLLAAFAANSTGYRYLQLLSGTTPIATVQAAPIAGINTLMHLFRGTFSANAGDQFTIAAFQNSGGPLNLVSAVADSGTLTIKKLRNTTL